MTGSGGSNVECAVPAADSPLVLTEGSDGPSLESFLPSVAGSPTMASSVSGVGRELARRRTSDGATFSSGELCDEADSGQHRSG